MHFSVPSTMQMQAADCGAASLKMILDYYKCFYTLEEVRQFIGVGKDGSTIGDIRAASAKLGLNLSASQVGINDLHRLTEPCILWWDHVHFVVYEGFKGKFEHINDPAIGKRTLSIDEFLAAWTGVAITIDDRSGLKEHRSENIASSSDLLRFLVGPDAVPILSGLALNILSVIPTIILAQFTSYFTDQVLIHHQLDEAKSLLWSFLALTGIIALLSTSSYYILSSTTYRLSVNRSLILFKFLTSLPVSWHNSRSPQELSSRVTLPSTMVTTLSYSFAASLGSFSKALIILVFVFLINVSLGLCFAFIFVIVIIVNLLINNQTSDSNQSISVENGKQQSTSLITLSKLEQIRSVGGETEQYSTWAGYYTNYTNSNQKVSTSQSFSYLSSFSGTYLFTTLMIIVAPILIIKNVLSISDFIGLQFLVGYLSSGVSVVPTILTQYQQITSPFTRLQDALECRTITPYSFDDLFSSTISSSPLIKTTVYPTSIHFQNVSYDFDKSSQINDLCCDIDCTKLTCISSTLASKSTLFLKLLSGIYSPSTGEITIASSSIPTKVKFGDICYLYGDPVLIDIDFKSNLSFLNSAFTNVDMIHALQSADLFQYIKKLPRGLQNYLPNHGNGLSELNKRKIILARIFLQKQVFFAVDELLDFLPSESVELFLNSLRKESRGGLFVSTNSTNYSLFDKIITL